MQRKPYEYIFSDRQMKEMLNERLNGVREGSRGCQQVMHSTLKGQSTPPKRNAHPDALCLDTLPSNMSSFSLV